MGHEDGSWISRAQQPFTRWDERGPMARSENPRRLRDNLIRIALFSVAGRIHVDLLQSDFINVL